jgi:hypothetical protein
VQRAVSIAMARLLVSPLTLLSYASPTPFPRSLGIVLAAMAMHVMTRCAR